MTENPQPPHCVELEDFSPRQFPPGTRTESVVKLGPHCDGVPIALSVVVLGGASEGKWLTVLGAVHGDEYQGPCALMELTSELNPAAMAGGLIAVPVANPLAYRAGTRAAPEDGLNLARVFPGKPDGRPTERIAHCLTESAIAHADLLVDLHAAGTYLNCPTLCGHYDLPGDLGRVSHEAALAFGAPTLWISALNEGRSISEAVRRGIPAIYAETTGMGTAFRRDVEAYKRGIVNVMSYLGILGGAPEAEPPSLVIQGTEASPDFDVALMSLAEGLLVSEVELLDHVEKGQVLAEVRDPFGRALAEVKADRSGYVMSMRSFAHVKAGDLLFLLDG